ncbi:(Fe-S)-binding protein [Syntrophobacter fumaroxidans]|uniref:Fe-S cluster domain protein n=1 Tax=Syntrophobacter fumaroxidans (strain DSM 10017 / MPOB) TaxID=335543 RepID=A0LPB8_SYNFM|nr:(Fe-S)-binding protein [Syntrophobacter fumaroxidans]ABK19270.1 Fe-S cluster domain protein [Syntrophobacter fumaroxidans MPOB]
MLLKGYRKEVVRPECRPEAQSVHCVAHLDEDIGEVIPYLNAVLGGFQFTKDPLCVSFKVHGKLIAVHPRKIAVNALRDEEEGDRILEWLKREINDAWERRAEIEPRFEGAPKPKVIEILRFLPKTNCRQCGQPTCMVFATQVADGGRGPENCPPLTREQRETLASYLERFQLE